VPKFFYGCVIDYIKERITAGKMSLKEIRMCIIDSKTFDPFKDEFGTFIVDVKTNLGSNFVEHGYIEFGPKNSHILNKIE